MTLHSDGWHRLLASPVFSLHSWQRQNKYELKLFVNISEIILSARCWRQRLYVCMYVYLFKKHFMHLFHFIMIHSHESYVLWKVCFICKWIDALASVVVSISLQTSLCLIASVAVSCHCILPFQRWTIYKIIFAGNPEFIFAAYIFQLN